MNALNKMSLGDPGMIRAPWDYYDLLRREDGPRFDVGVNAWLVTRYDDLLELGRKFSTGEISNERGWDFARRIWQEEVDALMSAEGFGPYRLSDNFKVDPPIHKFRRKLLEQALIPARVAALEPTIRGLARTLIDAFIDSGHADIVRELSVPLSLTVIGHLLNIPPERTDDMFRWSEASVGIFDVGLTKDRHLSFARDIIDFQHYMAAEIEKRRSDPGEDIISAMVSARDENGAGLTLIELLSIALGLITAGNETTRNAISFGVWRLAENPDLLTKLRVSDPSEKLIEKFVEEVLRVEAPAPNMPRLALRDCVIGGTQIREGDYLIACWGAGGRDENRFSLPDTIDLQRNNSRQHLAFGSGANFCIGAPLARLEMRCLFSELVQRIGSLTLDASRSDIPIVGTILFRGPSTLPIRFEKT